MRRTPPPKPPSKLGACLALGVENPRPERPYMLIEVEVTAGANSPLDLHRMFDLLDAPRPVFRVMAPGPDGADLWCDVTGWENHAPGPAMAATAEDSGEGVILLIYGGADGIRLRPAAAPNPWSLSDPSQWGEPCLMLAQNAPAEMLQ